jgi:hypothetical protein
MSHIELQELPILWGACDNIFTTNLMINPTIKDTIIRTIKDGGDKQNRQTNVKATMTDWNMEKEPGFVELEQEINSIINYLPNILIDYRSAHAGSYPPMEIDNMWGLCYKKNDFTKVHTHWPATWSGVFYLDIPTDYAGTLFFPELEHNIEPISGQLVIFSGTTKHGVKTFRSTGERLAVSFNYKRSENAIYR